MYERLYIKIWDDRSQVWPQTLAIKDIVPLWIDYFFPSNAPGIHTESNMHPGFMRKRGRILLDKGPQNMDIINLSLTWTPKSFPNSDVLTSPLIPGDRDELAVFQLQQRPSEEPQSQWESRSQWALKITWFDSLTNKRREIMDTSFDLIFYGNSMELSLAFYQLRYQFWLPVLSSLLFNPHRPLNYINIMETVPRAKGSHPWQRFVYLFVQLFASYPS